MGFFIFMIILVIGIAGLLTSIVFTKENHYSFITVFGKYNKTLGSGLGFKIPFISSVDKTAFLGLASHKVHMKLKTSDQVTFLLNLNIQYVVSKNVNEAYKGMYNIVDYLEEMSNISTNSAISLANSIEIENVFNQKEQILDGVHDDLNTFFADYGITITQVLSDEPVLPKELEDEANEVMKAKRQKEAATYKAEAIKTEKVGAATADGESVKIRMNKLGESRKNYAEKTAASIDILIEAGCSPKEALDFLNQIGEQDAIVTSSRNGSTIIFHDGKNGQNQTDALLVNLIEQNKQESNSRDEKQEKIIENARKKRLERIKLEKEKEQSLENESTDS